MKELIHFSKDPVLRKFRIQVFTATWLSYAGFYFTRKVFSVVKGPIKERLMMNDLEVSHLFTAYLIAYMLGMFLTAFLGRRMKNRTQLLFGMGVSILCNLMIGSLLSLGNSAYFFILFFMALHGFAQAVGWPNNVGIMANWTYRSERGTLMATWGTCYQFGSVLAKSFASFLFAFLGLYWSFWGTAFVLLGVWILFFFWAKESPESCGFASFDEALPVSSSETKTKEIQSVTPNYSLIISMGIIYFSFKFLRYALDSWTVLVVVEKFKVSTSTGGLISTVFDWVGFLGVLTAGILSDQLFNGSRSIVIFLMTIGSFFATLLMWLFGFHSIFLFILFLGLIGFMDMGPDSLLSGAGAIEAGNKKDAQLATAIINGLGSIGPIFQEPIIGWVKTYQGIDSVFLLLVVMNFFATLGTFLLWYNVKKYKLGL
jgi:sugar phosphate permease